MQFTIADAEDAANNYKCNSFIGQGSQDPLRQRPVANVKRGRLKHGCTQENTYTRLQPSSLELHIDDDSQQNDMLCLKGQIASQVLCAEFYGFFAEGH